MCSAHFGAHACARQFQIVRRNENDSTPAHLASKSTFLFRRSRTYQDIVAASSLGELKRSILTMLRERPSSSYEKTIAQEFGPTT